MFVRTTRFLFLMLLASACTFVLSGKALADSQTENEISQTNSVATVEQSSQQILETTHEVTEVTVNEQVTTESNVYHQSSYTNETTTGTSIDTQSSDSASNNSKSKSSNISTLEEMNNLTAATLPSASNYVSSSNFYYYHNQLFNSFSFNPSDYSVLPSILPTSTSSGSSPLSSNLPIDSTRLVLRVLATVFQAGQNIIVTSSTSLISNTQIALGTEIFFPIYLAGAFALASLVLVSILLSTWHKNGFANAARSDVDDLSMVFAATKRGFAYYFASLFFVTANIKNKTI